MATLFSSGYQRTASPEAFAAHLARHDITLAIDVRRRPTSQRPGYDKGGLGEAIEYRGITYRSVPDLGNLDSLGGIWAEDPDRAQRALAEHFLSEHSALIDRLAAVCDEQNVCLICVCPRAAHCHRQGILLALAERHPSLVHCEIPPA